MHYFLLISVLILGLWISSIAGIKVLLSYRAYKFILQESDKDIILDSYDEIYYTQNQNMSPSLDNFLAKVFKFFRLV
jgi:hypothetical protein